MPNFRIQSPADELAFRGGSEGSETLNLSRRNTDPDAAQEASEPDSGITEEAREASQTEVNDATEVNQSIGAGLNDEGLERLQLHMSRLLQDTRSFVDGELSPARSELSQYYNGEPFGNEVDGRSKVVSTDVRDVIQGMMPSLMRVLCGPEAVVEAQPRPGREQLAMQQTDYLNLIFFEDNPGYRNTHAVLKDGLLKRLGGFKCWHEDVEKTEGWRVSGLTQEQVLMLQDVEGMTVNITGRTPGEQGNPDTFEGEVTYSHTESRIHVVAVPPEELWYNRSARDADEAALLAHVKWVRKSDLIERGIPEEYLEAPEEVVTYTNVEAIQRNPHMAGPQTLNEEMEETEKVFYAECYTRWAREKDGPVAMYKVVCVGPSFKIIPDSIEPADRPFFLFVPDPEQHSISGLGIADYVKHTQKIKSAVIRSILDSANLAVRSRTWGVEGQVSLADVQNEELGSHVRVKAPGMFGEFTHSFMGQQLFPILQYFDDKTERSTGQANGAQGLDPDSLQSATETAVAAQITQSQQHLELIARLFAETCLKPLFRHMLKLVAQHQDRPRVVRMRGTYVEVNPKSWDTDLDFRVNVGLGTNSHDHKLATLSGLAAKHEFILQTFPNSPLAAITTPKYLKVLNQIAQLQGYGEGECFPSEQEFTQAQQQAQQQPPPPNPALIEAQAAATKVANTHDEHVTGAHIKIAGLQLKREQQAAHQEIERQKVALKAVEVASQSQAEKQKAALEAAGQILDHHAKTQPQEGAAK